MFLDRGGGGACVDAIAENNSVQQKKNERMRSDEELGYIRTH